MNHNQSNALSHSKWRPPYPSENLKTPRMQPQQQQPQQPQQSEPLFKTFSTTNPYATQQEQQEQRQEQRQTQEHSHSNQFQELNLDHQHSKRENNSDKIYERGPTPQVGMNPFLKDSNYLQDLDTQNQFLKPVNTNLFSSNNKS
jgi:hypothetical protein